MGNGSGEDRRLPPRRRCDEDVLDRFVVVLVVGVGMVVVELGVVVVSGMGEYQFRLTFPLGVDVDRVGFGDATECPATGEIGMGTEILDRRWRGDTEGGWEVPVAVLVFVVVFVVVGWIITERRRPGTGDALTGRRRWGGGASTFAAVAAAAVEGGLLLPMNSVCFFLPAGDCPSSVRKAEG